MPAALVDDAMHHRQSQSSPFPDILGGKKRFENPALTLDIDAVTGITDRQSDIAARFDTGMPVGLAIIEIDASGFDPQRAAIRHRVAGVEREIQHHLLELAWIGLNQAYIRPK